jgi:hypothetical protein
MPSILRRLLLACSALLVIGCQRPDANPADVPAMPAAIPPAATAPAATAPAEAASAEAAPTAAGDVPAASAVLVLDPEGLRIVYLPLGASRLLSFGLREPATVSALTAVLGAKPVEQGEIEDCNASYVRWKSGLRAWFTAGNFSGWAVPAGASGLATATGLEPGSTRAELEAAYDASVFESSLGTEFTAGDLAGVLSSAAPDGRITHLWAGTTCIAR